MGLSWSVRRKFLYTVVGIILLLVLGYIGYQASFNQAATCFDSKQNGDEQGVDCGGSCQAVCQNLTHAPILTWSRMFPTASSTYTAAAYIQNNNVGEGAKGVSYSFQLFDAQNNLIVEKNGVTDLPPVQTIPIIEPNIDTGNAVPTHATFSFSSTPLWVKVPADAVPSLQISGQTLAPDGSRLSATITNNTPSDVENLAVAAVLFDSQGTARAASKSTVAFLPAHSSQSVVFTWPLETPDVVRAEITIIPSF